MTTVRFAAAVLALGAVLPGSAEAQVRASERGSVSQTIDGTVVAIDYGRPQTRGRDTLYGGVIPWGKVWTPGANWATTLETNRDITIDGQPLAAGRYSVWFQVKEGAWTAIFDPSHHRYHIQPPEESAQQVRLEVRPEPASFVEVLTWSFPEVRPTGATLQMAWGDTAVALDIGVHPSRPLTVEPELAERFIGSYRLKQGAPFAEGEGAFDISYEDGRLVGRWEHAPNDLLRTVWLVHLGEGMFMPVETKDGELVDAQADIVFEFDPVEGRANGFELRILGDMLAGTATRVGQ